jgi:short subunit dehydrogenase-like uncharacterized protein
LLTNSSNHPHGIKVRLTDGQVGRVQEILADEKFMKNFLIYGANGYTGELIAREAAKRGLKPILSGRSQNKIEPLAKELNLTRTFSLEDKKSLEYTLKEVDFVFIAPDRFR